MNEGFLPSPSRNLVNRESFTDHLQALKFLRQLDMPIGYWRRLDHHIGLSHHNGSSIEIENAIATAILRGKIQFQRIEHPQSLTKQHIITGKNNNTYIAVTADSITLFDEQYIVPFSSISNAKEFLQNSDISTSQQGHLIQSLNVISGSSPLS